MLYLFGWHNEDKRLNLELHPLSHARFSPARARVQRFGFWGDLLELSKDLRRETEEICLLGLIHKAEGENLRR